jgi:hypothetical protein
MDGGNKMAMRERNEMKFFNTAGPVNQKEHYKVDPLQRWDLEEILFLIEQKNTLFFMLPDKQAKQVLF